MRATACMVAWALVAGAPPQASVLFWRRRLGSYHSQPLLGGRKPQNATNGAATAMQLSSNELSSAFSVASLGCRGSWPIELITNLGLRPPCFFLRRQRRGTLCYDLLHNSSRERDCCPGRHSLRFTIYRLGGGCRCCPHICDGLPL